ncbi:MAG: ATP-binding cassette domain-containing protein [Alkalinema sp. RU_4_3]|nr:ATP-binding cassette domain-containing protein [Alkalinema sp. RU_4_3]
MSHPLLDVRNLQVQFKTGDRIVNAIKGISLQVYKGQTLGIVGESGSGKSVTSLAAMGLIPSPPVGSHHGATVFMEESEGGGAFDVFLALGGGLGRREIRCYLSQLVNVLQKICFSLEPLSSQSNFMELSMQ